MTTLTIHVPVARTRRETYPLAPRLATLAGSRIALFDNRKANAAALLNAVAQRFAAQANVVTSVYAKDATTAAPKGVMAHLEQHDAVVLAIAD